jgi:hypothetical protein
MQPNPDPPTLGDGAVVSGASYGARLPCIAAMSAETTAKLILCASRYSCA